MKRLFFLNFMLLFTLGLFSQIHPNGIVFSLNGNYSKSGSETGVTSNCNSTDGKYLNLGASFGNVVSEHVIIGFGLDYSYGKETREYDNVFETERIFYGQFEEMDIKSKSFIPFLYFDYYYSIMKNLYLDVSFKFHYGEVNSKYSTIYYGIYQEMYVDSTDAFNNSDYSSVLFSKEGKSSYSYCGMQLVPELTYFYKKLGFSLQLGGMEYGFKDWKTKNSIWNISFNPVNWQFGFKFCI
jgi:hypothetical protein